MFDVAEVIITTSPPLTHLSADLAPIVTDIFVRDFVAKTCRIYDTYVSELLTLRFKVNTSDVGSSEPSTMTLSDSGVINLMITERLEDEIELLTSSGIHTIEQLRNMTEEDRKKYCLSICFRGVMIVALSGRVKRQKNGGNKAGLQSMLSILETL